MENSEASNLLLKKKYDLHNSPEVKAASRRTQTRTGQKVPQEPVAQIQNYLDRFKEIIERTDAKKREHGIEAAKKVLLSKFTTRLEDIPDSYWQSQERILRERGQQGDYERFSQEEKTKWKREISEGLLADQRASLEQWIDYFASGDSSSIPDYVKYWVFRSVTGLQEYDKEKQEFPKRSKGTVKMFPDINHEALSYVVDALVKKQKGEPFSFEEFDFDLTDENKQKFQQNLLSENFANLYAWANEQIAPIPQHLLPITEGAWVKYDQDADTTALVRTIRGRGTGWCTAGENTARIQLQGGNFYVFYSNDETGTPTIPRIAIRMEQDKIAEVRGIAYKQNLDPYMSDVLVKKLDEFPDKDQYLKKEADMKKLTEIEQKAKRNGILTSTDLTFLYEIDSPIEGFGYESDPRIAELRSQRNPHNDMLIIFDSEPTQIAHKVGDIGKNTRAYVGPLEKGIFKKLQDNNIEHVYTSFPEGRIRRDDVLLEVKTTQQYEQELRQDNINIASYAASMMKGPDFPTVKEPRQLDLVRLHVRDLGLKKSYPTTTEVFKRAEELGLELCPPETGPQYRLKYKDQPMDEWFYIGMKPIPDSDGNPLVFNLGHRDDGLWLHDYWTKPDNDWRPGYGFVFSLRKPR